jgi:hypothetical protein
MGLKKQNACELDSSGPGQWAIAESSQHSKIPSARFLNRDPAGWISPSVTINRIINTFQHFFFRHFVLPRIIGVPVNEENKTAFMPTFGQHPVSDSKEPLFVPEAYLKF